MKKKALLLIVGILIGVLALAQIFAFNSIEKPKETSTTSTDVDSLQQNSVVLKTAAYYVLSFIKHQ